MYRVISQIGPVRVRKVCCLHFLVFYWLSCISNTSFTVSLQIATMFPVSWWLRSFVAELILASTAAYFERLLLNGSYTQAWKTAFPGAISNLA